MIEGVFPRYGHAEISNRCPELGIRIKGSLCIPEFATLPAVKTMYPDRDDPFLVMLNNRCKPFHPDVMKFYRTATVWTSWQEGKLH